VQNDTPPEPRPNREEAFDVAKGIGILAVVGLHVSNRSGRLFHQQFSNSWWILTWINRFLNFCVPLFLLLSAILLARSLAKQEPIDWKRFARRRLKSVLFPLVLWTVIYWLLHAYVRGDAVMQTSAYWLDVKARLFDLVLGKAEFHLYFLAVLLQLCLILPFLVLLLRRIKLNIWTVTLIAIIMQTLMVLIQKQVQFKFPASIVLWYASTILPAVWVGMNWREWPQIRRTGWPAWAALALGGFAAFAWQTWLNLVPKTANGTLLNASTWAYVLGAGFLILAGVTTWTSGAPTPKLIMRRLGEMSLQVYLMHPILMQFLTKDSIVRGYRSLPLPSLWFFVTILLGTYAVAWALDKVPYVNFALFGRDLPPRASSTKADHVQ
jgi:peptidoglycan/LPS O-acetylase OafA/YrhL